MSAPAFTLHRLAPCPLAQSLGTFRAPWCTSSQRTFPRSRNPGTLLFHPQRALCPHVLVCPIPLLSPRRAAHFHPVASFIHEGRLKGGVLVHCYAGVSRSAALLAGYLILRHSASLDSAVQMLRAARPSVDPNPGFRAALRRLEATCRESGGEPADRDGLAEASEAPGCPSLSEDGERGGQRGVAEAGPVGESVEEQRRAALERMEALIQSRGVFVGRARVRAAAGGERECAEGWRVGGRRCTEIVVWKGGQLAAGVHGDATLL